MSKKVIKSQTIGARILEAHTLLGALTMYECSQAISDHTREYLPSDLCIHYRTMRQEGTLVIVGQKFNVRTDRKRQQKQSQIYAVA